MSVFHDEVEIEDFAYEEETGTYRCPCGVRILITREDLECGEDVATCSSRTI
ncbi:DPH3 homolog [Neopelma chrysocephalum]|uniref:DPH3 homolog n=1 Tax=Neopelma chrysocephalum TaxID=114329 RepID=UPI000FCCF381|nr:DPH3 homolog [Neopelma chrysocephalum]